jgi:hypothetical protein
MPLTQTWLPEEGIPRNVAEGVRVRVRRAVTLLSTVVDLDVNIGECPQKTAQMLGNVGSMLGLDVAHHILGAHRIHGFFPALVADFVEPPADKGGVLTQDWRPLARDL